MTNTLLNISSKLSNSNSSQSGLLHGELGKCLALYHIGKRTNDKKSTQVADHIFGGILQNISKIEEVNFENGLAGIGFGIYYLQDNGFIIGSFDGVYDAIDNKIYKFIAFNDVLDRLKIEVIIGIGAYLLRRLKDNLSPDDRYLLNQLMILLINALAKLIESNKELLDEPPCFNIYYRLPLCVSFLEQVRLTDICSRKIDRMQDYLTPIVCSMVPNNIANRLYLYNSIKTISRWKSHSDLLCQVSKVDNVVFIKNDISILRGRLGFKLMMEQYGFPIDAGDVIDAPIINTMEQMSLISGLAGIGLILSKYC